MPEVVQRLGEEARVQQVQDRVLDAADVLVDRQPVVDDARGSNGALDVVRRRSSAGSTTTSRRTCPSCRSRAAPGRRSDGHVDVHPLLGGGERRAAPWARSPSTSGSSTGSSLVGHRHDAAALAVDDRDRAAPVALARDQPVAQPVVDRRLAEPLRAQPGDDRCFASGWAGRQESPEFTRRPRPSWRRRPRSARRRRPRAARSPA